MKRRGTRLDQSCISIKNADKNFWKQFHNQPRRKCIDNTDYRRKPDSRLDLSIGLLSVVKTHDRGRTVGQTLNGHRKDLSDRIQDRHNTHIQISPKALQGRVARHLHQTIGKRHNKT